MPADVHEFDGDGVCPKCGGEVFEPADRFKGNPIEVSTCCFAVDRPTDIDGPSYEDIGYCPECRDHTEFITVCDECSEEKCECPDIDPVNVILQKEEKVSVWNDFRPTLSEGAVAALIVAMWIVLGAVSFTEVSR